MSAPGSLISIHLSAGYPSNPELLRDVFLEMDPGQIVGLIGESASGKSTLALAILGLLKIKGGAARGQIFFQGRDLMLCSEREMRQVRGRRIGLVLQSPHASLNPYLRIGTQLREAWRAHSKEPSGAFLRELLPTVSLPGEESFLRLYPRELSVGQAQRVLLAMAIMHRPVLLIADEPTSALDCITQSEVLELFGRLSREMKMGILFISHDLLSVASLCDRVAILHQGAIVESGTTEQIFAGPAHPYARRLIASLPKIHSRASAPSPCGMSVSPTGWRPCCW